MKPFGWIVLHGDYLIKHNALAVYISGITKGKNIQNINALHTTTVQEYAKEIHQFTHGDPIATDLMIAQWMMFIDRLLTLKNWTLLGEDHWS